MRYLFVIFSLFFLLTVKSFSIESIFLMPKDSEIALKILCKDLGDAKKSIKASIYSFTHYEIAKAIKKAAKNGAKIEIIFDEESNLDNKDSQLGNLAKIKNIEAYTIKGEQGKKKYYGKMHMKIAIIDDKKIYFGSANWSHSAFSISYELLYSTTSQEIIDENLVFFNEMLKNSTKY
ncbi:MAG: hypothetical protein QG567_2428 [Campylobacterota bacterium]|nr:hypothetical protein [Campylobacterota bacterium]